MTNPQSDEIWIIDAKTREQRLRVAVRAPGGGAARPFGLIMAPSGDRAWVTMSGVARVAELGMATGSLTRWMDTGMVPDGIGYAR